MAAYFHSSASEITVELGEYEEFTRTQTSKSKFRHLSVVVLSFSLLCVLQAVLNISLRLTLAQNAENITSECLTTKIPAPVNRSEEVRDRRCPPGWLQFRGSCYFISAQRKDWDESRRDCERRGALLVIVNDRQEQSFLTGFTAAAWVGMTDRQKEGTFFWLDGTLVDKNKLQWAPGQPDNAFGGEDCGDLRTMNDFIGLNDAECSNRIQWICESPLSTV